MCKVGHRCFHPFSFSWLISRVETFLFCCIVVLEVEASSSCSLAIVFTPPKVSANAAFTGSMEGWLELRVSESDPSLERIVVWLDTWIVAGALVDWYAGLLVKLVGHEEDSMLRHFCLLGSKPSSSKIVGGIWLHSCALT